MELLIISQDRADMRPPDQAEPHSERYDYFRPMQAVPLLNSFISQIFLENETKVNIMGYMGKIKKKNT